MQHRLLRDYYHLDFMGGIWKTEVTKIQSTGDV